MARTKRPTDCFYCTEPIKKGDHAHCLERLETNYDDVPGKKYQHRYPPEVKACIMALRRMERKRPPEKVCPICATTFRGRGSTCSLVHTAALRRWLKSGRAKIENGTVVVVKPSGRIRSGAATA